MYIGALVQRDVSDEIQPLQETGQTHGLNRSKDMMSESATRER